MTIVALPLVAALLQFCYGKETRQLLQRYLAGVQSTIGLTRIARYTLPVFTAREHGYNLKLAATLRGSRPGVQSASLIMTSLMAS